MMGTREATRELARFASAPLRSMSEPALRMGKHMVLNAIGLAAGAAFEPAIEMEYALVASLRTPPEATAFGRGVAVGASWAALMNGTGVHLEDFDDTYYDCKLHPTGAVPPAALAMGEYARSSGRALIEAVVAGTEVAIRVGNALGEPHYDLRWQATGTFGHLGAAVAAGRLLGLDAEAMETVLALAATEAGGVLGSRGTMGKPFHVGKAAFDGVEAAFIAKLGMTRPHAAIEGPHGMAAAMSGQFDEAACLDGLGQRWEIERNVLKPYACGVVSHPIIDATIELRQHFASPAEIERIDIRSHPMVLDIMGFSDPRTGLETKFSSYHCAAVGFMDGFAGPRQFSDEYAVLPHVAEFRRRIHIDTTPEIAYGCAIVTAHGVDGRTVTLEKDSGRVMTQSDLERKVRGLIGDGAEPLFRVMERLEELERLDDLVASVPAGVQTAHP